MQSHLATEEIKAAIAAIRDTYAERALRHKSSPGRAMFESRLAHYGMLFRKVGLLPLGRRRILDVGCANGKWLELSCKRWGATSKNCVGVDLRSELLDDWRREHPGSMITLVCQPIHELEYPDASFDVVHQSMMLSSVPNRRLRDATARTMWRLLRPGGCIVSYDFWINPLNRMTVPIPPRELMRLFPNARVVFERKITLAVPICRLISFR
jgi:ubiquinone/menaquinone biosynthesis C-methylase UbiE